MRVSTTRVTIGLLVLAAGGLARGEAEACSCIGPQAPCAAVWQATAVFRGRVVSIAPMARTVSLANLPRGVNYPGGLRVTFERFETLRGDLAGAQVEIVTESSEASCGYTFTQGAEYVVYAYAYGGLDGVPLSTSLCSRTALVEKAGEDLAYLRTLLTQPDTQRTRIFGRLTFGDQDLGDGEYRHYPPPAGVTVVLTRPGGAPSLRRETSVDGAYSFDDLPVGRYRVSLELPETLTAGDPPPTEVALPTRQACADASFHLSHNGRVAGRVLNAAGAGVPGAAVGVMSEAGIEARWTRVLETASASDGSFELRGVPPGRYLLGINLQRGVMRHRTPPPRVFYPGTVDASAARPLELGAGQRLVVGTFTLPAGMTGTAPPK